ncbi:MAG: UvrD-helicase domain-containing protein [Phycisphaerales bacterium]|nr:MAG: UvrD-helicase domain-containing protein [Phycisphaerales bacterium]
MLGVAGAGIVVIDLPWGLRRDIRGRPREHLRSDRRPASVGFAGSVRAQPLLVAIISGLMPSLSFTDQQLQAIGTTGRSVIVSAAAGSGKTAVLAERCAYLVCDAPPDVRCDVNELLVLTFTDAAAAEMRARIVETIRGRLRQRPHDDRLKEQMALVDAAQISTIHSFCLWLVRRWFSHVDVDPAASVLDAEETTLLKNEVLDTLLSDLYATGNLPDEPLGRVEADATRVSPVNRAAGFSPRGYPSNLDYAAFRNCDSPAKLRKALGPAFIQLVDDYGLGDDRNITRFILRLFDFLTSLPAPEAWLREACESLSDYPERVVLATVSALKIELDRQVEHCEQTASAIEAGHPGGHFYASQIRSYSEQLRTWAGALGETRSGARTTDSGTKAGTKTGPEVRGALARFETVRQQIADFEFSKARGPRLPKDAEPVLRAARDAASAQLSDVIKKRLFGERLKRRFGLFSVEESVECLKRTAPYVAAVAGLTLAFRDAYQQKKRGLGVLDFADLERLAFELLHSEDDPPRPSDIVRVLHRRFAHVLVDEFQDINPIQQAIIELVSRESDPDRPDNLFVVGDVKQSIYRFRLAEPSIFTERLTRFREKACNGVAVSLQSNFRSRSEILEAINAVFRQLMREGCSDIVYDAEAELRPGRDVGRGSPHQPVELHLLERSWRQDIGEDEEPERGVADLTDPARWTPIEREAFLIGSRIRAFMEAGGLRLDGEPLRYRDIAVLLRATKINAERMAAMLTSMGIPAYADVGGSLFGAREIRDLVAALELLDNFQQDIPLAAVLRSGIVGRALSEDDLIEIRCLNRDIPFHAAVRQYVKRGVNLDLRERLSAVLERISRYRTEVRRRPLSDVLWSLYERQGFLAYVGGLPGGAQRRANLLKLHELARRFGSFRQQGLHRFLRFIRSLEEEKQSVASAPAVSEADDVVQIMSIHQAKGLEFPVVFVAGLGTKFNLGDRSGRMIFERSAKIGLRVVDTEQMTEYPSAAHWQAAGEIEQTTRHEELRILYVAMTRARDKLVLVGSSRGIQPRDDRDDKPSDRPVLPLEPKPAGLCSLSVATAMTPLDWLIPVLAATPCGVVCRGGDGASSGRSLFDVQVHDVEEMANWRPTDRVDDRDRLTRRSLARCGPLPSDEPLAPGDPTVEEVLSRIEYAYPESASTSVPASVAASEFKGAYDFTHNPEQRRGGTGEDSFRVQRRERAGSAPDEAARRGVLTHRILQHLDFTKAVDAATVASELQRMAGEGLLCTEDLAVVDRASIEWFVSTPLGAAIREAGDGYRREFPYIAAERLAYFDRSVGLPPDDHVLVRGIVDGILPVAGGIDIVDFKTDALAPEEVAARAERYRPQANLYARAMSRLWRQPVRACRLVFLTARRCHVWRDGAWEENDRTAVKQS